MAADRNVPIDAVLQKCGPSINANAVGNIGFQLPNYFTEPEFQYRILVVEDEVSATCRVMCGLPTGECFRDGPSALCD